MSDTHVEINGERVYVGEVFALYTRDGWVVGELRKVSHEGGSFFMVFVLDRGREVDRWKVSGGGQIVSDEGKYVSVRGVPPISLLTPLGEFGPAVRAAINGGLR